MEEQIKDKPEVTIFIDVKFNGQLKCGTGTYTVVLEAMKNGEPKTKEHFYGFTNTTKNRTAIRACISAMNHLTTPCKVKLIINSRYMVQAAGQGWYKTWLYASTNAKNEPAKNIDLWQQLSDLLDSHEVTLEYAASNTYSAYMTTMARKAGIICEDDIKSKEEQDEESNV